MKKNCTGISLFELPRIASQWELLAFTHEQPTSDYNASSQKGSGKSFGPLELVINVLTLEANTLYPLFLLTFEIFNYNVHNFLVDYGAFVIVMPLSVANKINTKWGRIDAWFI